MRVAAALLLIPLAACRVAPSPPRPAIGPVPAAVVERFELDAPGGEGSLAPVHVLGRSSVADAEAVDAPSAAIELTDVLDSVERSFPLVLAALEEVEIAGARLLAAEGGLDTRLATSGKFRPSGAREADSLDLFVEQPLAPLGASLFGGYRIGSGDFYPYEEGALTDGGGEFRVGGALPLLQGRSVDARRVAVWRARLEQELADPEVRARRIEIALDATRAYWAWVAAGRQREVARRLLGLARDRTEQLEVAVTEGELPRLTLVENERLVVEREAGLVRAERGLERAAIALSLYWRDEQGRPEVPVDALLPYEFPAPLPSEQVLLPTDVEFALKQRPEPLRARLEIESLDLERELTRNQSLPRLDLGVAASQDLGGAAKPIDDKGDFELQLTISGSVPLQRRDARGRSLELDARRRQLERSLQLEQERVVSEVQDARSALSRSWEQIGQARRNVDLANRLAEAERFQFSVGESDLLRVNLREQQTAVSAARYVDVLREHFEAVARYRAVLGIPHRPQAEGAAALP